MRLVITLFAAVILGLWTLVAWAAAALVEVAGTAAATNADVLPVPPEWVVFLSEILGAAGGHGSNADSLNWGHGAIVIGAVALLALALTNRRGGPRHPAVERVRDAFDRGLR